MKEDDDVPELNPELPTAEGEQEDMVMTRLLFYRREANVESQARRSQRKKKNPKLFKGLCDCVNGSYS